MNYELAALKLMCAQLKEAQQTSSSPSSYTLHGILFQRLWFQGVLVSTSCPDNNYHHFLLDDGTGIIQLQLTPNFLTLTNWQPGMYVMVVGSYIVRPGEIPAIRVHKIVDLSAFPDREAMWYLEVVEVFRTFYQPVFDH